jgi:L-alanine-DL-glutamate epimerase-like enolase superfamily enzyme
MRITSITTFLAPPRWLFVKVETDAGISGWGEAALEGRAHTVAAAVDELSDHLIGKDPRLTPGRTLRDPFDKVPVAVMSEIEAQLGDH